MSKLCSVTTFIEGFFYITKELLRGGNGELCA